MRVCVAASNRPINALTMLIASTTSPIKAACPSSAPAQPARPPWLQGMCREEARRTRAPGGDHEHDQQHHHAAKAHEVELLDLVAAQEHRPGEQHQRQEREDGVVPKCSCRARRRCRWCSRPARSSSRAKRRSAARRPRPSARRTAATERSAAARFHLRFGRCRRVVTGSSSGSAPAEVDTAGLTKKPHSRSAGRGLVYKALR